MTASPINPELDLTIERFIAATPRTIWDAWTRPELLVQWWIPAPLVLRVNALDLRPAGAFSTSMSEDGTAFVPHVDGIVLSADPGRRFVFTNAIDGSWHPALPDPVAMTTEIILTERTGGTDYRAIVRHGSPEQRARHEELGFFDGWSTVTDQLTLLVQ